MTEESKYDRPTRGGELLEQFSNLIRVHDYSPADVGFVCAFMGAHTVASGSATSGDEAVFEENVQFFKGFFEEVARERWKERASTP